MIVPRIPLWAFLLYFAVLALVVILGILFVRAFFKAGYASIRAETRTLRSLLTTAATGAILIASLTWWLVATQSERRLTGKADEVLELSAIPAEVFGSIRYNGGPCHRASVGINVEPNAPLATHPDDAAQSVLEAISLDAVTLEAAGYEVQRYAPAPQQLSVSIARLRPWRIVATKEETVVVWTGTAYAVLEDPQCLSAEFDVDDLTSSFSAVPAPWTDEIGAAASELISQILNRESWQFRERDRRLEYHPVTTKLCWADYVQLGRRYSSENLVELVESTIAAMTADEWEVSTDTTGFSTLILATKGETTIVGRDRALGPNARTEPSDLSFEVFFDDCG